MMGIYIKGMEMPEHCGVCRFAVDGWCYAYGKPNLDALANDGRTNFCPLVPIPPHGRLGDLDALITTFCEWGTSLERKGKFVITMAEAKQTIVDIIEKATTIIPAEPQEEEA